MDPFVELAYFTTPQAQNPESLTFSDDLTIRFLWSLCKRSMKKKDLSECTKNGLGCNTSCNAIIYDSNSLDVKCIKPW